MRVVAPRFSCLCFNPGSGKAFQMRFGVRNPFPLGFIGETWWESETTCRSLKHKPVLLITDNFFHIYMFVSGSVFVFVFVFFLFFFCFFPPLLCSACGDARCCAQAQLVVRAPNSWRRFKLLWFHCATLDQFYRPPQRLARLPLMSKFQI
jgi:hypothetical protein